MPLDIANLDAPESESAPIAADTGGTPADSAGGNASAGAPEPVAVAADPAGDSDAGDSGEQPAGGEPEPAVKKPGTVPHAALHEARETNKALKARIAELEAVPRLSADDAALLQELRAQRAQPKKDAEEQPPDFLQDPKGYVDSNLKQAIKEVKEATKEAKEAKDELKQHQTLQAVITTATSQVNEFVATTADYPKAIEHVRNVRRGQLEMLYPQATADQIGAVLAREEITLASQIVTQGKNFAEFAYEYAKKMGYQPPKPPDPTPQPAAKKVDASAVRTLGSGGTDSEPEDDESSHPNSEFRAIQKEAREEVRARFRRRA